MFTTTSELTSAGVIGVSATHCSHKAMKPLMQDYKSLHAFHGDEYVLFGNKWFFLLFVDRIPLVEVQNNLSELVNAPIF